MAVDPSGSSSESGTAVVTSAALALSKQARQGVSEQVEKIINSPKETDKEQQQLKPVEDGSESEKTSDQQQSAAQSSSGQTVPERGRTVNIEG